MRPLRGLPPPRNCGCCVAVSTALQFLVVGEDVVLNMVVCVEDYGDILGVRGKVDRPEHRALWNTAHERCTLFAVD